METPTPPILIVGAGIAGMTAALEAAEAGHSVVLVERSPAVGGRVVRSHQYFPKLCPPTCGMEINIRRLESNPRVRVLIQTEVIAASSGDQGWSVTLTTAPMYVNERCTACGECSRVCPARVPDSHNLAMIEVPAIRLAQPDAWPRRYTLDRSACPPDCRKCVEACVYGAVDLGAQATEQTLTASAAVMATGWDPYPLQQLPELGGGRLRDVIANVQMERMVAPSGPTGGTLLRPSDGKPPRKVAFVQCAGSRDVKHLAYCSGVCCLASLKQATYVRSQIQDSEVTIYYIDRRTPGRNEDLLTKVSAMEGVRLVKGKVGKIEPGDGGQLVLRLEDVEAGRLAEATADLVVLATGMVPGAGAAPFALPHDENGFGLDAPEKRLFVAGVARRPDDVAASVRDATGAAAKAIVSARGGA